MLILHCTHMTMSKISQIALELGEHDLAEGGVELSPVHGGRKLHHMAG